MTRPAEDGDDPSRRPRSASGDIRATTRRCDPRSRSQRGVHRWGTRPLLRARIRRVPRRTRGDSRQIWNGRPPTGSACARRCCRRRGHNYALRVRCGIRGHSGPRGHARVRRHRPREPQHRREPNRTCDHGPYEGAPSRPPLWVPIGDDAHPQDRQSIRAVGRGGLLSVRRRIR